MDAAAYRGEGLTEEQLRYPLPPRDHFADDPENPKNAQLQLMHKIVDELYQHQDLDGDLYATFKAEQCRLTAVTSAMPSDLSLAVPQLKACGLLEGRKRPQCAAEAADPAVSRTGP